MNLKIELIQAGGGILVYVIHKLINSICNKEELPDHWKESIIVPVHKKSDKTDCNNYRGILLLLTSYKTLLNTLLSRLSGPKETDSDPNVTGSGPNVRGCGPTVTLMVPSIALLSEL
jgi:hypothetical protein